MNMWNPYEEVSTGKKRGLGIGAVLAILAFWALLAGLELFSVAKLPSPWACVEMFFQLVWDPQSAARAADLAAVAEEEQSFVSVVFSYSPLLEATVWSIGRVAVAAVTVVLIGVPVGVVMGASPLINSTLSPLVDPFRSAPVVAFLPMFVIWLGIGESMKIAFLFLGAVVFLVPMVRDAIQAVPQSYWISARDLGASEWESVYHAVLPMAKPRIADAIIVAVSVMWTYITVAEYVNAQVGLGQIISQGRRMSSMPHVLVGIFVIIAVALITYSTMTFLKRKLYPWETE
jgi:ABC-type nitrate/sulfonate/bicarbonate transport system permease component